MSYCLTVQDAHVSERTFPRERNMSFAQKLEHYADLAIRVGLNLQPGQRLLIIKAQIEMAPFVRLIADKAYQAARLMSTSFGAMTPSSLADFAMPLVIRSLSSPSGGRRAC